MYPFWEPVIAPLVRTAQARRIVEIGALRGETTVKMLDDLGPDAEIHVIDPLPQFDPAEHVQQFPGQYIFHRDLSLKVLPEIGAFDFALIDGDHNWYTVYNECSLLGDASRRAGVHLPLMVLHDVTWPYGRRDLYYDPTNVPEDQQQPWDTRGMVPGIKNLVKRGGMNVGLANALEEGGPRNGVRTGLDDFIAEHDQPIRQVILPIYYGLAIVAEEAYLDDHPAVREMLDRLESLSGVRELLELSESIRLDEAVFGHNMDRRATGLLDRSVDRHLRLLRSALLDQHHVENEVRMGLLLEAATTDAPLDVERFRAPRQKAPRKVREVDLARREGDPGGPLGHFAFTNIGRLRLDEIDEALRTVDRDGVAGDLVEVGCGRGGVAIYMRGFLDAREIKDRDVWVVDEFRAGPTDGARPLTGDGIVDLWSDLNQVRDGFDRFDLLDERVRFVEGPVAESLPDAPIGPIALLRIGRTASAHVGAILDALNDRLADGAIVLVEDETDDAAAAITAYRNRVGDGAVERLGWSGIAWRHSTDGVAAAPTLHGGPVPLATAIRTDTVDLSVIVVFHNMIREAARTLHTLTRGYQRGIERLSYEVIVLDNGSDPDQRLDEEFVRSFGEEFRLIDMGPDANPSPVAALNHGMVQSRGKNLAFMIDGAHMLTPGVLHNGMKGLRAYQPSIVATQQWYVGPGQQPDLVGERYDQAAEDQLFENIDWPADGYRLFEIGHFIGERDWLDGILESNCLFVGRPLLEQVGAFDEGFSMPGGGYANLELYERLGAHPRTKVVTILGEGSFHQVHGGTTTNDGSRDDRRKKTFAYGDHYRELRGRTLGGPGKHINYVGSFTNKAAARTRSRRLSAMAFDTDRAGRGEFPTHGVSMPDELTTSMIDGFWHTLAWKDTTWLGEPVHNAPTDLMIYQELISKIRPDHIIVTEQPGSGTARFAATICELLGHGEVVSIGDEAPPAAPRLRHVAGKAHLPATIDAVVAELGDDPHAMVILGSGAKAGGLKKEFLGYSPLVSVGSYLIFENTIVNGRPVWADYGPGPLEAIRGLLPHHGEFVQDTEVERFGLTFNPGGFLRRMS
jgi:cephalosporin hydroxylase